jgi:transcriptional regulator with XRE-family HTH domain
MHTTIYIAHVYASRHFLTVMRHRAIQFGSIRLSAVHNSLWSHRMTRKEIGEKLADLRERKEWNQDELAEASGFSRGHVSNIERGLTSPSIEDLDKLVQACGITLRKFFESKVPDNYKTPGERKLHERLQDLIDAGDNWEISAKTTIESLHTSLVKSNQKNS